MQMNLLLEPIKCLLIQKNVFMCFHKSDDILCLIQFSAIGFIWITFNRKIKFHPENKTFCFFTLQHKLSLSSKTKQSAKLFEYLLLLQVPVVVSGGLVFLKLSLNMLQVCASAFNHSDRPQFDRLLTDSSVVTRVDDIRHVFV